MTKISIVTSLYRSSAYVDEFYTRHLACIQQLGLDYEFVFVDDGYPDDAAEKVKHLQQKDVNIRLVLFSRNFGQYPAMFAGITTASGDYVYTTDSDLEEAPENILTLYSALNADIDFIYGVVEERTGGLVKAVFGGFFFRLMNWISDVPIPQNMSWQLIMSKKYKEALLRYNESETLPAGLMALTGFKQKQIKIEKSFKGVSTYSFRKRLKLALNSITAFSSKPLVFIGLLGMSITSMAFLILLITIIRKLFFTDFQSGWISIIVSIWLVGGLILSSVGIIGIYLAKVFNQVKNRPLYIIKEIIG